MFYECLNMRVDNFFLSKNIKKEQNYGRKNVNFMIKLDFITNEMAGKIKKMEKVEEYHFLMLLKM